MIICCAHRGSCRGRLIVFPIQGGRERMTFSTHFIHPGHPLYHFYWITLKVALFSCSYLTFFGEGISRRLLIRPHFLQSTPIKNLKLRGGGDDDSSSSSLSFAPLSFIITIPQSFQLSHFKQPSPPPPPYLPFFFFGGSVHRLKKKGKERSNSTLNNSHIQKHRLSTIDSSPCRRVAPLRALRYPHRTIITAYSIPTQPP